MKTLKLFDFYTEFPFDEESLKKQIDSASFGENYAHILSEDVSKIISKETIIAKYDRFKNENFYFKISEEYKRFFFELGIKEVDSFLFPNPLHDQTFLEFELFFAVDNIGNDFLVINKEDLEKIADNYSYESLKSYIQTMDVSVEYILRKTIDMNNYAFTDYKEGYLPEFNDLAQSKLEETNQY